MKKLFLSLILLTFFNGCVGVDPQGRGYSVAIPLDVINSTLAKNFPVNEELKYGIISGNLNISNPNVLGKSGKDKLGVGTSFKFTNMFIPNGISGSINLASGIRYDANTKNLYLKDPMVNSIKFQNQSLLTKLPAGIQNAIGVVISETIAKKPIYNLEKSTGIATSFVRGIDIRDGQVYIIFGL